MNGRLRTAFDSTTSIPATTMTTSIYQMTRTDDTKDVSIENVSWACVALSVAALIGLVFYGSAGLRGSDQYAYMADVQTLARGGEPVSNMHFPGDLLRDGSQGVAAHMHHNDPLMHFVAYTQGASGVYRTWIGLNLVFMFTIVAVVGWYLRKYTTATIANFGMAVCALLPINVWQTANMLRENYFGALTAVALLLYSLGPRSKLWDLVLVAVLTLGSLSHPLYTILFLAFALERAVRTVGSPGWLGEWMRLALYACVLFSVSHYKETLFPSSFQSDIRCIIVGSVPNETHTGWHMNWHFSDVQPELNAGFMASKIITSINRQFLSPSFVPFYFLTNLAFLAFVYLLYKNPHGWLRQLTVFALIMSMYIALTVLMQNSHRYQLLMGPVVFVVLGFAAHTLGMTEHQVFRTGSILVALCFAGSALLMHRLHHEAYSDRESIRSLKTFVQRYSEDQRLLVVDVDSHSAISYAVRPRHSLFIHSDQISEPSAKRAIDVFAPNVLVTNGDVPYDLNGFDEDGVLATEKFDTLHFFTRRSR